jgi:hypothetical protein
MRASRAIASAFFGCLIVGPAAAMAAIVYDEGVDGDISGDRLAPTSRSLSFGSNELTATSVSGDLEYITLSVPAGLQLDAVILDAYVSLDSTAFIAVQSGTTFTEPPTGTDVSNLLGWSHFGTGLGQVGTDILDDISVGAGAIGFVPPLSEGDYTYWIQQTGANSATYTLDFVVTPEPSTLALLALGVPALLRRRR